MKEVNIHHLYIANLTPNRNYTLYKVSVLARLQSFSLSEPKKETVFFPNGLPMTEKYDYALATAGERRR
ncbi:MAG TPA: hypothetical protein IAB56_03200 [Candidatus Scybalousia intestinigallinarum]|nr:hypothetical protein [Candidatus Scybalousia intestinigallinarum]